MSQGNSVLASHRVNDAILKAIVSEIQKTAEQPPPGFHPLDYWEKRWKCKRSCVKRYLSEGVKLGILERIELRRYTGKYVRRAPYYGPARKKARQKPPR
jgi:Fic family protein